MKAVLQGKVAGRVFDGAIAAFPANLALQLQCLQKLQAVGLPGADDLALHVRDNIARECGHIEAAWDVRARCAQVRSLLLNKPHGTGTAGGTLSYISKFVRLDAAERL